MVYANSLNIRDIKPVLQVGCWLTLAQQKERKTTMPEFQTQFNKISDNIQLQPLQGGFQYPNKSGFRFS